jgi:hypothetical protein
MGTPWGARLESLSTGPARYWWRTMLGMLFGGLAAPDHGSRGNHPLSGNLRVGHACTMIVLINDAPIDSRVR